MVRIPAFVTALVIGFTVLSTMPAAFADDSRPLEVEGQALSESLKSVANEFGLDIAFFSESTNGLRGVPLAGNYTSEAAFDALLSNTGLEHRQLDNGTVVVQAKDKGGDSDPGNGRTAGATPSTVMMAQAVAEQSQSRRTETDSDEDEERRPLEEIIVTGTNIRGIAPESSPVRVFDRQDIQISGAATAQDFIQTLPANFGGGSNSDLSIGVPIDDSSQFNGVNLGGTLGSSVNLRGLGSGATLVLLNGQRIAPSSGIGDFADISMIPASALERVEVLTDGASSIYGGDAIAGVVNFILIDDFDGVETSLRYGTVTDGDLDEYRASITGGKTWNTGNALIVYEYLDQENLSTGDRAFSQGAPLPNDLLPSQERHSLLASGAQQITQSLDAFVNFTFSDREAEHNFTSAVGATGTMDRRSASSENVNVSAGGSLKLSDTWIVDASGTYSGIRSNTAKDDITERVIDSDIWTADIKGSGTAFQLPGGDVKLAFGGHFRAEGFSNFDVDDDRLDRDADRDVYAIFGEAFIPIVGPDNAIPGIERLELNVSGRYDDYSDFGSTANPKIGVLWAPVESLNLRGSYSTSFNPPPLGRVGASDFTAIFATTSFLNSVRGFTPADPSIADVPIIIAFGTAADLEPETSRTFTAGLDFKKDWVHSKVAFTTTWFYIEFADRLGTTPIPDGQSSLNAHNIAFNNPDQFPEGTVIFSPTPNQIAELVDNLDRFNNLFLLDPLDAEILNLTSIVRNLSLSKVRGFDFDLRYNIDSSVGVLALGLDGTLLVDFQQQAIVTTPLVEQVNTLFNPVGLKLRGHAGYSRDGFSANVFLNYMNDYRVDNTVDAIPVNSWTTVDLALSFDTREKTESTLLNNVMLRLSVLNLLDEAPPSTPSNPSFGIHGFDPTNASPLGRFIAFEVAKRF